MDGEFLRRTLDKTLDEHYWYKRYKRVGPMSETVTMWECGVRTKVYKNDYVSFYMEWHWFRRRFVAKVYRYGYERYIAYLPFKPSKDKFKAMVKYFEDKIDNHHT